MRSDRSSRSTRLLRGALSLLMALAAVTALLWSKSRPFGKSSLPSTPDSAAVPVFAEHVQEEGEVPVTPVSVKAEGASSAPVRRANAYRMLLDGDLVSLEAIETIQGRFKEHRGLAARPGMLRCRLLDAEDAVLAEEYLPAPDYACVVLDPVIADRNGAPKPAALTAAGPVVFQARLPEVAGAEVLEIVRIESVSDNPTEAPTGRLLAQLALPSR